MEIRRTEEFASWLDGLRDTRARARILVRLKRLSTGHFGDVKTVGSGVSEMRIDYGPGYRVYFTRRGKAVVLLLRGDSKKGQARDIQRAIAMVQQL